MSSGYIHHSNAQSQSRPIAHPYFVRPKETSGDKKEVENLPVDNAEEKINKIVRSQRRCSSREDLDDTITTTADDPASVTAPGGRTHTFTTHQPVARDLLCTASFLEVPESQASVVARRDKFSAIGGQRKRCNGCWMSQHGVCTLPCNNNQRIQSYPPVNSSIHTTVSVKETNVPVLISADNHSFHPTGPSCTVNLFLRSQRPVGV